MEETPYYESAPLPKKDKRVGILLAANIVMAAAIVFLFVLIFSSGDSSDKVDYTPKTLERELRLAFINSDSLWANYEFVVAKKAELTLLEGKYQSQYDYLRKKFEDDYQAYIKKGSAGQLTLAQQKEAEAKLGEQQKQLMSLDEELSAKFVEDKTIINQMLLDTILNYIHRYNQVTGYDFILEYSKISGLLYANDSLDITQNIINGLNFEYQKWK